MKFNLDDFKRNTIDFIDKAKVFGKETRIFSKTKLAHKIFMIAMLSCWGFGILFSFAIIPPPKQHSNYFSVESSSSSNDSFSDSFYSIDTAKDEVENVPVDTGSASAVISNDNSEESVEEDFTADSDLEQEPWWETKKYDEYGNIIPPPELGPVMPA